MQGEGRIGQASFAAQKPAAIHGAHHVCRRSARLRSSPFDRFVEMMVMLPSTITEKDKRIDVQPLKLAHHLATAFS
jgi:hypothetical protein